VAIELFDRDGWAGTTLAAVADAAGVSVETIYNGFGSKRGLLRAAMEVAVAGDAEEVPVAERPAFAALGEGDLSERIERAAELILTIHERSAGVWRAVVEAAGGDPEVDRWRVETEAGRRVDVARGVGAVLGRPADDRLVTLLWVLYGPETYRKLVEDEAMSRDDYRRLLIDATTELADAFA